MLQVWSGIRDDAGCLIWHRPSLNSLLPAMQNPKVDFFATLMQLYKPFLLGLPLHLKILYRNENPKCMAATSDNPFDCHEGQTVLGSTVRFAKAGEVVSGSPTT